MTLPWFRVDTNIATHDKILALLSDPSTSRWQAAFSYVCSIGWSAASGTDGRIPLGALPMVHATPRIASLLVKYHLWHTDMAGFQIHNYANYQQLSRISEEKSDLGRKAACVRWHGPDCWGPDGCTRESDT
jgi:hypothetical protein